MRNLKKFLALVLAMMMVFSLMVTVNAASTGITATAAAEALDRYGVLEGFDGDLQLTRNITRAQMAAIVYRIMTGDTRGAGNDDSIENYGDDATRRFTDANQASWALGYIGFCANHGILVGYGDGTVKPNEYIKGYQVLAMLLRALGYGRNGEYEGAKWTDEVLIDATWHSIYGGALHVNQDPAEVSLRGTVAQMTYNALNNTYMVEYNKSTGQYPSTGVKLITATETKSTDVWGAPCTSYTTTFNWPDDKVTNTKDVADDPIVTFYTAKSQCNVYDAISNYVADGTVLDTYTNGKGNVGKQLILDSNTTAMLGAQGREMRVYKDRIVYRDTVLINVPGSGTIYDDSVSHPIGGASATADATVYWNEGMEAVKSANAGATGANPTNHTLANKGTDQTYKIARNGSSGLMTAYILTGTDNNQVDSGTAPATIRLLEAKAAEPVEVTVLAMIENDNGRYIGFVGTNGVEYLYDITFGRNTAPAAETVAFDGASGVQVLSTKAINKTYYVYTDGRNNVLGIAPVPVTTSEEYGVVTYAEPVMVPNPKGDLSKIWAVEYTVLLPDKTTAKYKMIDQTGNEPFKASDLGGSATDDFAVFRNLVHVTEDTDAKANGFSGYYVVTPATKDLSANAANNLADNGRTFYVGDADIIGNNAMVDNNTVFFVARYDTTNSANNAAAYTFKGNYDVYIGFQSLPTDLKWETNKIYDADGNQMVSLDGGSRFDSLDVYAFNEDDDPVTSRGGHTAVSPTYASYVLIEGATNRSNMSTRAEKIPSYAYVLYSNGQNYIYDDYYLFNMVKGTTTGTLKINSRSGDAMINYAKTNSVKGSGLYIYVDDSENEGDSFSPTHSINWIDGVATTGGQQWAYNGAGVLTVLDNDKDDTGRVRPNDVSMGGSDTETATGTHKGWNSRYYTVAKDAKIYIVNEQTNYATTTPYTLTQLRSIDNKGYKEMYFELNEYGWITTIYLVDENLGGVPGTTVDTSIIRAHSTYSTWYTQMGITSTRSSDGKTVTFTWSNSELNKKLTENADKYADAIGVMSGSSWDAYMWVGVQISDAAGHWFVTTGSAGGYEYGTEDHPLTKADDNFYGTDYLHVWFNVTGQQVNNTYPSFNPGTYTTYIERDDGEVYTVILQVNP